MDKWQDDLLKRVDKRFKEKFNMDFIITKNGYCLTLRERKIMMLMQAETDEIVKETGNCNPRLTMQNLYFQLGLFVTALSEGYINQSDLERCE